MVIIYVYITQQRAHWLCSGAANAFGGPWSSVKALRCNHLSFNTLTDGSTTWWTNHWKVPRVELCPREERFAASMAADEQGVIDHNDCHRNNVWPFWLTIQYAYLNHKHLYLYVTFLNYQSRSSMIYIFPLEYLSPKLLMNPGLTCWCERSGSKRLLGIATVTTGT